MKKTLIALMALAGVAVAEPVLTFNMDSAVRDSEGNLESCVSLADNDKANSSVNIGNLMFSEKTYTVTITLSDMYCSENVELQDGQKLMLTSIQVVSRNDATRRPEDATITVSGNTSAVADYTAISGSKRDLITFRFDTPIDITDSTSVSIQFNVPSYQAGQSTTSFGYSAVEAKSGHTLQATPLTFGSYGIPVRLNVTATPEPATATLSLLALAALASRRKRH